MTSLKLGAPALALALGLGACFAPPTQSRRVTDAAREMNIAARFGRMDIAVEHAARGARQSFLERRADWGHNLRVLDVQLSGLSLKDEHHASVHVDISWERMNEGMLRQTRVAQLWRDTEKGGWQLVREKRIAGDFGLFGENVEVLHPEHRDAHFPSKTIR